MVSGDTRKASSQARGENAVIALAKEVAESRTRRIEKSRDQSVRKKRNYALLCSDHDLLH